jgi:hypothetical protein
MDRLEEIIERIDLEGPDRVTVVGRHEDHGGRGCQFRQQVESRGAAAQLHVEEHHIRLLTVADAGRGPHVRRLADDSHAGEIAKERRQPLTGGSFIVHDDGAKWCRHAGCSSGEMDGTVILTTT